MSILVIAECDARNINPTCHAVAAALRIGGDVHVLLAGADCMSVAEQVALLKGVAVVKVVESEAAQSAETLAVQIARNSAGYSHILAPGTRFGQNVLPRVAALLNVAQISDVSRVESADTFVRCIYAGNALATVRSNDPVKVLTIRPTAFEAVEPGGQAVIEMMETVADSRRPQLIRRELNCSERPELGSARVVVAGGRGLGSREDFQRVLCPLADKLGAALGASYGAVNAGYVSNDYQVGQTGKIVAPDLYIAVGISGAIQHLAGMKDSRIIVAINKDPEAPIFKVADYGLVADLFDAVPALVNALG